MCKISVIIPIYNTEKYLERCVESVLNQTYTNFELLLIDDGSTDNSIKIIRDYENKDQRIKVYSQPNQGVSVARNLGIENSTGQWCIFIDSDDYISKDYLETIAHYTEENIELLLFKLINTSERYDISSRSFIKKHSTSSNRLKLQMVEKTILMNNNSEEWEGINFRSPCAKAYKVNILKTKNIKFPIGVKRGEDELFNIDYYMHVNNLYCISKDVYKVENRADSVTHKFNPNLLQDDRLFQIILLEKCKKYKIDTSIYSESVIASIIFILKEGIFHQNNCISYNQKIAMCRSLRNDNLYSNVLEKNWLTGTFRRRICLFFFKIKMFRCVKLFIECDRKRQ